MSGRFARRAAHLLFVVAAMLGCDGNDCPAFNVDAPPLRSASTWGLRLTDGVGEPVEYRFLTISAPGEASGGCPDGAVLVQTFPSGDVKRSVFALRVDAGGDATLRLVYASTFTPEPMVPPLQRFGVVDVTGSVEAHEVPAQLSVQGGDLVVTGSTLEGQYAAVALLMADLEPAGSATDARALVALVNASVTASWMKVPGWGWMIDNFITPTQDTRRSTVAGGFDLTRYAYEPSNEVPEVDELSFETSREFTELELDGNYAVSFDPVGAGGLEGGVEFQLDANGGPFGGSVNFADVEVTDLFVSDGMVHVYVDGTFVDVPSDALLPRGLDAIFDR